MVIKELGTQYCLFPRQGHKWLCLNQFIPKEKKIKFLEKEIITEVNNNAAQQCPTLGLDYLII